LPCGEEPLHQKGGLHQVAAAGVLSEDGQHFAGRSIEKVGPQRLSSEERSPYLGAFRWRNAFGRIRYGEASAPSLRSG
jgi:hypothetical protein